MSLTSFVMPIVKVTQETHDVRTFRFQPPAEFDKNWKPGQFITAFFPDDPKRKRAYSLSSSPLDDNYLEVTVKKMGDFGSELYGRGAAGLEMNVIPPRGKFLLPDDAARPLLFIAGGSGVTPYRGMMRYIMQQKLPTLVTVLYSARTPQDIIFKAEFEQMCAQTLDFKFVVTCTRCTPADHWAGWHGRITPSMVLELMQDPERTVCYVCGGRDFVRGTAAMLAELSLPKERLVYEDSG